MKNADVTGSPKVECDLQAIARAWPKLSENVKKAIRTIVALGYADGERRSVSKPMTEGAINDNGR